MRNFRDTQQARGHFEFGSGIFARLFLLAAGFVSIFFFQLWGYAAYLVVTVVYCRSVASKRGKTVLTYPLKRGHGAPSGDIFMYCILLVLGLVAVSIYFRDLDVLSSAVLTWMRDPIFSDVLNCTASQYTGPHSCKALHTATYTYVFLTPILISVCLHLLIAISQYRLRVSRSFLFYMYLFTTVVFFIWPLLSFDNWPASPLHPFMLLLIFCFFQLMLIPMWVRITAE